MKIVFAIAMPMFALPAVAASGAKSYAEVHCKRSDRNPCKALGSWSYMTRDQLLSLCARGNTVVRTKNACHRVL